MARVATSIAVALLVLLAGCSAIGDTTPETTSSTAATTSSASGTTTASEYSCVGNDPPKGSELFSVRETDESNAMAADASQRFVYRNLSERRQTAFRESLERDCNLVQDAFHYRGGGIYYVRYEGQWSLLRVSIV